MNVKRVLTALIGFPIVIVLLVFGNKYVFDITMALIAIISMNEYIKCVSKKAKVISWISYLSVATIALIHIVPNPIIEMCSTFGIPVLLLILFLHVIITNMKITFEQITYTLMGICYILGFIVFIPLIYGTDGDISGKMLVWYVLGASWGTDVFAYIIGKRIGKTKFSKVSPNKSIEGCVAGVLGTIIINLGFTFLFNNCMNMEISYLAIGIISIVLSFVGQVGDFSASVIKRSFEIKDFSELFPGHGGMIDRIDSVMYIAPFAYLLLTNCL